MTCVRIMFTVSGHSRSYMGGEGGEQGPKVEGQGDGAGLHSSALWMNPSSQLLLTHPAPTTSTAVPVLQHAEKSARRLLMTDMADNPLPPSSPATTHRVRHALAERQLGQEQAGREDVEDEGGQCAAAVHGQEALHTWGRVGACDT